MTKWFPERLNHFAEELVLALPRCWFSALVLIPLYVDVIIIDFKEAAYLVYMYPTCNMHSPWPIWRSGSCLQLKLLEIQLVFVWLSSEWDVCITLSGFLVFYLGVEPLFTSSFFIDVFT